MILINTISREYYRQNVGFYLFILLFGFGFLSSSEHVTLSKLCMANGYMIIWVVFTWLLHVIKTTLFFHRTLLLPEYALLHDFSLKNKWNQIKELFILQLSLNAPFLAYSAFMVFVALKFGSYIGIVLVITANVLLLLVPLFAKYYRLSDFNFSLKFERINISFDLFPNWASLYYLRHLLKNQPILFFSTKIYSSLFIIGGANLFYTDEYDVRLLFICSLLAVAGHFPLGEEYSRFIIDKLNFKKNFPLSLIHIFRNKMVTAFWLVLIDIVVIWYHWIGKVPFYNLVGASLFFSISMLFWLVFSHSNLIWEEKYIKRIYFFVIFLFVLVMFNVPIILFGFTIFGLTWWIFKRNYFNFEL
jgi:hypothetical protein